MATPKQRKVNVERQNLYIIRDEFPDKRPAGDIDATYSQPGPGKRTVVDTDSKLTIGA